MNAYYDRVSMHGLRRELYKQQVDALGISYSTIELSEQPSMAEYERIMKDTVSDLQGKGFECSAFGDIFLDDLKKYRDERLAEIVIPKTASAQHGACSGTMWAVGKCAATRLQQRSSHRCVLLPRAIGGLPFGYSSKKLGPSSWF